jgi:hypothetical protein
MRLVARLGLSLAALLLAGCASLAYDLTDDRRGEACELPGPPELDACADGEISYEEYAQVRKAEKGKRAELCSAEGGVYDAQTEQCTFPHGR